MSHIEFIGPPGAGKSSVFKHMCQTSKYFDIISQNSAVIRSERDSAGFMPKHRANILRFELFRAANIVYCEYIKELSGKYIRFDELLHNTLFKWDCEMEKYSQYKLSGHLDDLLESNKNHLENDFMYINKYSIYIILWYIHSCQIINENEKLVMDEGFFQLFSAIDRRLKLPLDEIDSIVDKCDKPDHLIHVTASPEVCIRRQQSRGRMIYDPNNDCDQLDLQRKMHNSCNKVLKLAKKEGVNVISINNESKIEVAVKEILDHLDITS